MGEAPPRVPSTISRGRATTFHFVHARAVSDVSDLVAWVVSSSGTTKWMHGSPGNEGNLPLLAQPCPDEPLGILHALAEAGAVVTIGGPSPNRDLRYLCTWPANGRGTGIGKSG